MEVLRYPSWTLLEFMQHGIIFFTFLSFHGLKLIVSKSKNMIYKFGKSTSKYSYVEAQPWENHSRKKSFDDKYSFFCEIIIIIISREIFNRKIAILCGFIR